MVGLVPEPIWKRNRWENILALSETEPRISSPQPSYYTLSYPTYTGYTWTYVRGHFSVTNTNRNKHKSVKEFEKWRKEGSIAFRLRRKIIHSLVKNNGRISVCRVPTVTRIPYARQKQLHSLFKWTDGKKLLTWHRLQENSCRVLASEFKFITLTFRYKPQWLLKVL